MVMSSERLDALDQKLNLELRRGVLTLAVLSAVRSPTYGYSLKRRLADRNLEIDQGTLYPLLRRLDAEGLLESDWVVDGARPRKYYRLSLDGEKVLEGLRDRWGRLVAVVDALLEETPEPETEPENANGEEL